MQRCGAKKRDGTPCPTYAMPNGRCRMHGGSTPRGHALPQTTHGRHSRDLPTRLAARYEQSQRDPQLLSVRDDLALVDARLADVLSRVDTKEAGLHWSNASKALERFDGGDPTALDDLRQSIGSGLADYAAWSEVLGLIERRRKLAETEMKTLATMQQMLTVEQATVFAVRLQSIIKGAGLSRDQLAYISREMSQLVNHGDANG